MTLAQSYRGSATQSVGASPLLNKAWHMLPPPDFKRWSLVEPRACDPRLVEHLPGILSRESYSQTIPTLKVSAWALLSKAMERGCLGRFKVLDLLVLLLFSPFETGMSVLCLSQCCML